MDYSSPPLDLNYTSNSSIVTNEVFENSVFKLSNIFLDSLFSGPILPEDVIDDIINDPDSIVDTIIDSDDLAGTLLEWTKGSRNFFAALVVGLLFFILMPLIGLIFCCARCCCKCGKGRKNSTGDSFVTAVEVVIMAILVLLATLSMAWLFSANNFTDQGLNNLPDNIHTVVTDSDLFISNTVMELEHVSGNNYNEFTSYVKADIDKVKDMVQSTMDEALITLSISNLTDMAGFFNRTLSDFQTQERPKWKQMLDDLKTQADGAYDEFNGVRTQIVTACENQLPPSTCDSFLNDLKGIQFDTSIIPTSSSLDGIEISQDVLNSVSTLKNTLDDANKQLNDFSGDFIDDKIGEVDQTLDDVGQTIKDSVKDVISGLKDLSIGEDYQNDIEPDILNIQDYFKFLYAGFLAFGLVLVFILVLYVIGMILGSFGSVGGPTKKTGGCCLCSATILFFLLSAFLWSFATIFFLVGSLSDHFVCKTLEDPASSELAHWADAYLNTLLHDTFESTNMTKNFNISIGQVIENCRNDTGIYSVLELQNVFDLQSEIDKWTNELGEFNQTLIDKVDDYINGTIGNLKIDDYRPQLTNATAIFELLDSQFTDEIRNLDFANIFDLELFKAIKDQIVNTISDQNIEKALDQLLDTIEDLSNTVDSDKKEILDYHDTDLVYQNKSITETINMAIDMTEDSYNSLLPNGTVRNSIHKTVYDSIDLLLNTAQGFADYVVNYVETEFAKCGPIINVYDLVENAICYQILQPFNGIWTGLGLYLILMIPILIMSCLLEPLFRRKKRLYNKNKVEMTDMTDPALVVHVKETQAHPRQQKYYS